MKFMTRALSENPKDPVHILGDDGQPICAAGRSIDPSNRKTLLDFPPKGRLCRFCSKKNAPTILMPHVKGVKAEGQILKNFPVPSNLVDPDELRVGSTRLSVDGSKLLMLQLNPSGVTWYYAKREERDQDIDQLLKLKP